MKPPGAMDAKRPGAFVSSDAGGTSNVNVGVTPAMLPARLRSLRSGAPPRNSCGREEICGQEVSKLSSNYTLENSHTLNYTRMLRTPYEQDPFGVRACARPPPLRGRAEPPPDPRLTSAPPPQRSRGSRARPPIKRSPPPPAPCAGAPISSRGVDLVVAGTLSAVRPPICPPLRGGRPYH